MAHFIDCDFKIRINELRKHTFIIGEGEISGSVDITESKISISDGWNIFPDIDFNFCPICGHSLHKNL